MVKCLPRTGLRNGMAAVLIILNQYRQEFGQLLFFAGSVLAFVKTQKLAGQPFTFLIRPDDVWQRPAKQLPIYLLVKVDCGRAHCFQSPRSYSACVKI